MKPGVDQHIVRAACLLSELYVLSGRLQRVCLLGDIGPDTPLAEEKRQVMRALELFDELTFDRAWLIAAETIALNG